MCGPASSTRTGRCSMSDRRRGAAPMRSALRRRYDWRRCGATSSCNTPGCARCRATTPISGRSPAMRWISRSTRSGSQNPDLRERLMQLYLTLDAYPEAQAVLRQLRAAGFATAILSNGSPAMLAAAVEHAGLAPLFDHVLSIEEVGVYKPHPKVYQLACDRLGRRRRSDRFYIVERLGRLGCLRLWHARPMVQPPGADARAPARRPRPRNPLARRIAGAARSLAVQGWRRDSRAAAAAGARTLAPLMK